MYGIIFYPASEWLLFYCIPVLKGILPQPFFDHLQLLVCSMHILLSDTIAEKDLLSAKEMLHVFCEQFERLYGKKIIMYINLNIVIM